MKNKSLMKALSALLAVVVVFCSAPLSGFVGIKFPELKLPDWLDFGVKAEAATTYSGLCGATSSGAISDDVIWTLDTSTGILKITGEGAMADFMSDREWHSFSSLIKKVNIANGVTSIGDAAFYKCTNLKSITIPNSVTSIGDAAFSNCTNLKSITIPNSVTRIGEYAFINCISLIDVYYTGDIASWCNISFDYSYANPMCNAKNLYINNVLMTDIVIPDSVTSIGDYAFYESTSLASITISDGVESIGNYAFYGCTELTSVTIFDSITSIGIFAFDGCTGLKHVIYSGTKEKWNKISIGYKNECLLNATILTRESKIVDGVVYAIGDKEASVDSYTCTDSQVTILTEIDGKPVTQINRNAFVGNTLVTSITIPNSVTSIGPSAFKNCENLTAIEISDSVISIGESAFLGCTSLTVVAIPNSVTSIGPSSFYECINLTSITIPNSVTSIGEFAFVFCESLTSIIIPNSVTSIEMFTFVDCKSLASVTIPNSVTSIGEAAFGSCPNLESITIPNGVKIISDLVFSDCENLTSVTIGSSVEKIGEAAFIGCENLTFVYYEGKINMWDEIVKADGNDELLNAKLYCLDVEHRHTAADVVEENRVGITCTKNGSYDSVVYCTECKEELTRVTTIIYTSGHTKGNVVEENRKDATCLEVGTYDSVVYCTVCGEELSRETIKVSDAIGHDYETVVTKPTCVDKGYTTYTCSACGDSYIDDYVDKASHKWSSWEITIEPTMTTDGVKVRNCSACGETEEAVAPKTGITITLTDSDGNIVEEKIVEGDVTEYSFEDLEDGEYTMTVSKENYATREYQVTASNGQASCELELNLIGDINGDGKLTITDYTKVLKHTNKISALEGYDFACGDVDGNGKVTVSDYAKILKHVNKTDTLW